MEGSIFASILYVCGFAMLYAAIFGMKKSEKKQNGIIWLLLTLILEMCAGAFAAAIIDIVRIPINIWSIGIVYLIAGAALLVWNIRKKQWQKYVWKLYDILYAVGAFLGVAALLVYMAGPQLKLVAFNSDAAVHLKNAIAIVTSQKLSTMYFAPFQTAMAIEVMQPFIAAINYYKVFMIVDAAFFMMELIFFMVFIREYLSGKWMKFIGLGLVVLYGLGYPLNAYIYSFYYWGFGVLLFGLIILLLRYFRQRELNTAFLIAALMLACNAVTMCYMLFGPLAYVAAFLVLALEMRKREKRLFTKGNVFLALKVFLLPTLIAIYYCYFVFLKQQSMTTGGVAAIDGGIYREFYMNFILLLPFVIYQVICSFRQKKLDENMIFFLVTGVFVAVLSVFAVKGYMSGYYFYKFYYPLWFLSFVLTAQAIARLMKHQVEVFLTQVIIFGFLVLMHYGKIEGMIIESGANLEPEYRTSDFFLLYDHNKEIIRLVRFSGQVLSDDYFDACDYVLKNLSDEELVPYMSVFKNYEKCFWYEALTGYDCSRYYGWNVPDYEIEKLISEGDVNYIVVCKTATPYLDHKKYYNSFTRVYENDTMFVAVTH